MRDSLPHGANIRNVAIRVSRMPNIGLGYRRACSRMQAGRGHAPSHHRHCHSVGTDNTAGLVYAKHQREQRAAGKRQSGQTGGRCALFSGISRA